MCTLQQPGLCMQADTSGPVQSKCGVQRLAVHLSVTQAGQLVQKASMGFRIFRATSFVPQKRSVLGPRQAKPYIELGPMTSSVSAHVGSQQGRAPWMHSTWLPSDHTSTVQCRELASSSASAGSAFTPSWCTCRHERRRLVGSALSNRSSGRANFVHAVRQGHLAWVMSNAKDGAAYTSGLRLAWQARRFRVRCVPTGADLVDGGAAVLLERPHGSLALPRAGCRSARAELDAAHAHLKPHLSSPCPTRRTTCWDAFVYPECLLPSVSAR